MRYLRVLLIMLLSFFVVLAGTVAAVDVEQDLAKNDGLWLAVFVVMVVATIVAARAFRTRE